MKRVICSQKDFHMKNDTINQASRNRMRNTAALTH